MWKSVENPFCEHCMELEAYSLEYQDSEAGISYCETCALCDDIRPELKDKKKELRNKLKYFKKRVDALQKELDAL